MRYLSIDIEATGLKQDCLMIEFACVPFDTAQGKIYHELQKSFLIQCPSFEQLRPALDAWVIENNKDLIERAHQQGLPMAEVKNQLSQYFESKELKSFFNNEKIILFGKSMNAIDLPFMNRDFGWNWMRSYFSHRTLDFTAVSYGFVDAQLLPPGSESGAQLMNHLGLGEVAHTALEDAVNTAKMYLMVLEKISNGNS